MDSIYTPTVRACVKRLPSFLRQRWLYRLAIPLHRVQALICSAQEVVAASQQAAGSWENVSLKIGLLPPFSNLKTGKSSQGTKTCHVKSDVQSI